jgi:integrase/recombinase XerC
LEWHAVTEPHIRGFVAHQHRHGASSRTIQRRLSSLRTFFDFLMREGHVRVNPARYVSAPRIARTLPNAPSVEQMARLLDIPHDAAPIVVRDRAMLELLYSSALRVSELCALNVDDLLADHTVRVLHGKGRKTRLVPVGRQARDALTAWLTVRATLVPTGCTVLFVGRFGRRLKPRAVQVRVDYWTQRQRLGVHLHPHLFRHAAATHILASSGDLRGVQDLLGHADIATTQTYTHLDFDHLARVYDAAHPRARRKG